MPPSLIWRSAQYPTNGWSSAFGGYLGNAYPSAAPYGIVIRAPGSTGIFAPLNSVHGVKMEVIDIFNPSNPRYNSRFMPPTSIVPMHCILRLTGASVLQVAMIYYVELGMPLFFYQSSQTIPWPNMRKSLTIAGPGPPGLPLISKVGDLVTLTPWNQRGFKLLPWR